MVLTNNDILAKSKTEMLRDLEGLGYTVPGMLEMNVRYVIAVKDTTVFFIPFCYWSDHTFQIESDQIVPIADDPGLPVSELQNLVWNAA